VILYSSYFISLITFDLHAKSNVINLSRVAFERLKIAKPYPSSSTKMVYIQSNPTPALCICFASVYEDHTREAETRGVFPSKTLYAILHRQEYELMIANLCLLYKVPFIRSQIDSNRWAFSTRPTSDGHTEQTSLSYTCMSLLCVF
jgi:hypothetical protein